MKAVTRTYTRRDRSREIADDEHVAVDVQSIRLLYAEDDSDDVLLCMNQLEQAGIEVNADIATSRESFVKALQSNDYDIVLADYRLPGWSGIEVLGILKEDPRDIPCIMVTGAVAEGIAVACIKQGATDYILKDRPARLPLAIKKALEEKSAREKRKVSERIRNRLASIVESSLDAIVGAGEDGRIINWNPGAERMFGYSAEEIWGLKLTSLFAQGAQGESVSEQGSSELGHTIQRFEAIGVRKTGETFDVAVTISPIQDTDGRNAGSSAIVQDITDAKRMQKEFLTTQKLEAVGQLAGGVAHDFNNLLTVINGYARLLQRRGGVADPEKLNAILQAGERGQRLTKQLLGFSRKQITQFRHLDLNALVLGFLDMLRPLIGADIELRTVLAQGLPMVRVDAGQMEQVIMNLVVNARDAMPDGGLLTIETRPNLRSIEGSVEEVVTLAVSDSGIGMSPEVQARIFDPFFTTKEVGRGTGLGLSTTAAIISQCQGTLRVASELGVGTTFSIDLPAYPVTQEMMPEKEDCAVNTTAMASETILVAEDDATVRGFVVSVLQDQGYRVLVAENGQKALDLCVQHSREISALVTDVVMPEMNGRELAERARTIRPDLKVLFVSGYVNKGLKDEDIQNPLYRFLEKPFTGEALLGIVGEFCAAASAVRR